jgi:hypothetical protein
VNIHCQKNENNIFLIFKEIQMGSGSKSYMRKAFLIYEEMRKYFFLKVWWPNATLFAFIFLYTVDTFIHHSFIHKHSLRPISISSQLSLSGRNLHGVPSRDSNSGLPYSKPVRYRKPARYHKYQIFNHK